MRSQQSLSYEREKQGQQGWHVKGRQWMFVAFSLTWSLCNDVHHVVMKAHNLRRLADCCLNRRAVVLGLSKQAIRRFDDCSVVKVCLVSINGGGEGLGGACRGFSHTDVPYIL